MKKLIRNTLIFLLLLIVIYPVVLCFLGDRGWARTGRFKRANYDHLCRRMQELPQYKDVDILFLGSSHAYRTFDTRFYAQHGLQTFNLGSSNQTPIQTEVLLQDYLDQLNPRLVVFEVHADIMSHDGIESLVDFMINTPITRNSTHMMVQSHNAKAMNTWIYGMYRNTLLNQFNTFTEDSIIDGFAYVSGGFVEVNRKVFTPKEFDSTTFTIRPEQKAALIRCIDMFKQRAIPYILVEVQDAQQFRESVTNHPWFEQQMQALGPYYYKVLPLVDSIDFYDNNHLYQPGIEKYNQYLWDTVIKSYFE